MTGTYRLTKRDLAEATAELPDPVLYAQMPQGAVIDLYICALGFEPRCLSFSERLSMDQVRATTCLVLQYATNRDDNRVNLSPLVDMLSRISDDVRTLEVDDPQFVDRMREIVRVFEAGGRGQPALVALDISAMANRAQFRCMKVLLASEVRLRILYAEAEMYYPTLDQFRQNHDQWIAENEPGLEQGVADVWISRQFPGQQYDVSPDCVILFPNFKADRSNAVLSKVDPALLTTGDRNVVWLIGTPLHEEDAWRSFAMREINHIDQTGISHEVSTMYFKDTLRCLCGIYDERSVRDNISLSPLGSKMQTLGSVLFCYMHPDVRVIFAIPKQYNASQYSMGCRALWEIDLGNIAELRRILDDVGTLRLEIEERS